MPSALALAPIDEDELMTLQEKLTQLRERQASPKIKRVTALPEGEKQRLGEMLSYRRPHDSKGEQEFIDRYIYPLKPTVISDKLEAVHAFVVRIPGSKAQMARAYCAHTDSVHNRSILDTRQTISYDTFRDEFFVSDEKQRDCLGADDAAGCYILLRMIEAQVPGVYVFFRGEERGGIGSSYVEERRQDIFDGVTQAMQFDRRGTKSIITDMMCGTTCSDGYAIALGAALGMDHEPDPTGSFTDTANLASFLHECTNISVGYEHEHSSMETLDAGYCVALADRCIVVFADPELELPLTRKPGEFRTSRSGMGRSGGRVTRNWYDSRDYSSKDNSLDEEGVFTTYYGQVTAYDLANMTIDELLDMTEDLSVEEIATLLFQAGEAIAEVYPTYYDGQFQ